jgi:hypothetical protein
MQAWVYSLGSASIFTTEIILKVNFRVQQGCFKNHSKSGLRTKMEGLKRNLNS